MDSTCCNHATKKAKRKCTKCDCEVCNECALTFHGDHVEALVKIDNNAIFDFLKSGKDFKPFDSSSLHCYTSPSHSADNFCSECKCFFCDGCAGSHEHTLINLKEFYAKIKGSIEILEDVAKVPISHENYLKDVLTKFTSDINAIKGNVFTYLLEEEKELREMKKKYFEIIKGKSTEDLNPEQIKDIYTRIVGEKDFGALVSLYGDYIDQIKSLFSSDEKQEEAIKLITSIKEKEMIIKKKNENLASELNKIFEGAAYELNAKVNHCIANQERVKVEPVKYVHSPEKFVPTKVPFKKPIVPESSTASSLSKKEEKEKEKHLKRIPVPHDSKASPASTIEVPPRSGKNSVLDNVKIFQTGIHTELKSSKPQIPIKGTLTSFEAAKKMFDNGNVPSTKDLLPLASMTGVLQKKEIHKRAQTESSLPPEGTTEETEKKIPPETEELNTLHKSKDAKPGINKIKNIFESKLEENKKKETVTLKPYQYQKVDTVREAKEAKEFKEEKEEKEEKEFEKEEKEDKDFKEDKEDDVENPPNTEEIDHEMNKDEFESDGKEEKEESNGKEEKDEKEEKEESEDNIEPPKDVPKPINYSIKNDTNIKFELIIPKEGSNEILVYNTLTKIVERIPITQYGEWKFPLNFSYITVSPYIYISGGIVNEEQTNQFIRINQTDNCDIDKTELPPMKTPRSHHTMTYAPSRNAIFALTGSRTTKCEMFSLTENEWSDIPEMNYSRENSISLIYNESLYVFFGYEKSSGKYATSIEKLDITEGDLNERVWEVIRVNGGINLQKKMEMSYILQESSLIIIGGMNALKNDTKDVLVYDFDTNFINAAEGVGLPKNSSFRMKEFVKLPYKIDEEDFAYFGINLTEDVLQCNDDGEKLEFRLIA